MFSSGFQPSVSMYLQPLSSLTDDIFRRNFSGKFAKLGIFFLNGYFFLKNLIPYFDWLILIINPMMSSLLKKVSGDLPTILLRILSIYIECQTSKSLRRVISCVLNGKVNVTI